MYKKFSRRCISLFILIIFFIMSFNFIIDPGEIYLKKIISDKKSSEYYNKLINSEYGLVNKGWNERIVKTALSKNIIKFDCIAMGSSHIMELSTFRKQNISKKCTNIANLGVSGGTLEDIAIFSYLISKQNLQNKKVFLEISPWALIFNMDKMWAINKETYDEFVNIIKTEEPKDSFSYRFNYVSNLINYEYILASLKNLYKNGFNFFIDNFSLSIKEVPKFDFNIGYIESVTLPDGSIAYDALYLSENNNGQNTPKASGWYKLGDVLYQNEGIDFLNKIIEYLKKQGAEVNLILTPYNRNFFTNADLFPLKNLIVVEKKVIEISQKNKSKVYGSYEPFKLGCQDNEFYDLQHAQPSCLNKIDFSN